MNQEMIKAKAASLEDESCDVRWGFEQGAHWVLEQVTGQEPASNYCCHSCFKASGGLMLDRMILCSECGNKRCPKASDHTLQCTGSNELNQAGSVFSTPPAQPAETSAERTLRSLGYTNNGGEFWKPPLGAWPPQRTEQEPVAWMWDINNGGGYTSRGVGLIKTNIPGAKHTPLYTTPPQRTEQLKACVYCGQLVRKEKNNA